MVGQQKAFKKKITMSNDENKKKIRKKMMSTCVNLSSP